MAERKVSYMNRAAVQPPAYLKSIELNPMPWDHPHKTRRQELNHYEQGRAIGAVERDAEMEQRLMKRRSLQMQHQQRKQDQAQPPS
jgi:hypothetical protein